MSQNVVVKTLATDVVDFEIRDGTLPVYQKIAVQDITGLAQDTL